MEFNEVLKNRYSCRAFAARGVEKEKVDRILEAGRIAPTAVNKQPVHIWAVSKPKTLDAIKCVTRSNYGAPLLLVDAAIVATYLMLAAENEGLSTLWVGSFNPALLRDILPGTDGYELVAMINVGYPSPESQPSPMHGERKTIGELVTVV